MAQIQKMVFEFLRGLLGVCVLLLFAFSPVILFMLLVSKIAIVVIAPALAIGVFVVFGLDEKVPRYHKALKKLRNEPSSEFAVAYRQGIATAATPLVILCALIYFF